jgi:hypothetical protein
LVLQIIGALIGEEIPKNKPQVTLFITAIETRIKSKAIAEIYAAPGSILPFANLRPKAVAPAKRVAGIK